MEKIKENYSAPDMSVIMFRTIRPIAASGSLTNYIDESPDYEEVYDM